MSSRTVAWRLVPPGTVSARVVGLVAATLVLVAVSWASLVVGAQSIPVGAVVDALVDYDPSSAEHVIVWSHRVPRTAVGLLVGVALGLSGVLMQGITRNPLADPGLLGVNAGAAFCVVLAIRGIGLSSLLGYVWFAFAGAAAAAVLVYVLGAASRGGPTPVRLVLAGAAVTALLTSLTAALLVSDVQALDQFRFWMVGSLAGRSSVTAEQLTPFVLAGAALALTSGRRLNALALGDDVARALGQRIGWTRLLAMLAVVLLAGSATAAAGPIGFVGLVVPHLIRAVVGVDHRWILPYAVVVSPALLLGADVLGRVLAMPSELEVGVVTALVGGPLLIALVRRSALATG